MTNIDRIRAAMAEKGLPAMLLSDMNSVQWATGFSGSAGQVVLTPTDGLFITDSRYTIQAQEQVADLATTSYTGSVNPTEFLKSELEKRGIHRIGFESHSTTYNTFQDWSEKLAPVELIPVPTLTAPLRMVKTEDEIAKIRQACKLADACAEHVVRMIQPGVTEWDINLDIEFFFRRQGAELAFEPIVVSGNRSARPHGRASEKKLEVGDFLTLDFGCKVEGYCSDITRTFVVGEATERHERIYNAVLRSQLAAIEAIRAGVNGKDVDRVARDVLGEEGLAEYFGHGLGHGLGRLVHDPGSMSPRADCMLEPGMVLTVEPGVYIEGFGGVRIEDDVVVTETGCEILTSFPKHMQVLP
jgi:Xaa-Pro aminopeptidase